MMNSEKATRIHLLDRTLTYFNQGCPHWTHPYAWQGKGTLTDSGCGIFSLCHCIEWLTGQAQSPERWADFSCACGGRGDDGTDRPVLLHGLMASGEAEKHGFRYDEDGLLNDQDALFDMLLHQRGVALGNLRVGHIVALVAARETAAGREELVIDSHFESASERVRDHVREVVPGTEVACPVRNSSGLIVGETVAYGAFWVDASLPRDFNLLHRI